MMNKRTPSTTSVTAVFLFWLMTVAMVTASRLGGSIISKKDDNLREPGSGSSGSGSGVVYEESTHRLYFVPSLMHITDEGTPGTQSTDYEDVVAHEFSNSRGVTVKAIAQGATLVELTAHDGINYLWNNKEGATYYGGKNDTLKVDPNAFPLKRGLIIHGGAKFAAVSPEHGLYYDTEWTTTLDVKHDEYKAVTFSIVDNEATRNRAAQAIPENFPWLPTGLAQGQFNRADVNGPDDAMSKYPITNMEYALTITLREDEDFVRLSTSVKNVEPDVKQAEAWVSLAFPITTQSTLLSKQEMRWRRDTWCYEELSNMVAWEKHPPLNQILAWRSSCIFYDFPKQIGPFHGVVMDPEQGKGIVYIQPDADEVPHYTKLWSWGNKTLFDRQALLAALENYEAASWGELTGPALAAGRPATEYYEAWTSASNFAFFQSSEFDPMTEYSVEMALLPITSGLTADKSSDELLAVVDSAIEGRPSITDLKTTKVPFR